MENLERLWDSEVTGFGLWRQPTGAGGYRYWTDDNSIGRVAWDDAIDDPLLVFDILDREGSLENCLKLYYERKKVSEK
jgi:hypothetical protein